MLWSVMRTCGMSVVPEMDRCYFTHYGEALWYWEFVLQDYVRVFGEEVAKQYYSYPTINAGVFALHTRAPHWEGWETCIRDGLQRHAGLMTDQVALNYLIYGKGLMEHTEMLPAICNWSCNFGMPACDEQRRLLVEPYLPHTPIGILHLTGQKHDQLNLLTTSGGRCLAKMRYSPT